MIPVRSYGRKLLVIGLAASILLAANGLSPSRTTGLQKQSPYFVFGVEPLQQDGDYCNNGQHGVNDSFFQRIAKDYLITGGGLEGTNYSCFTGTKMQNDGFNMSQFLVRLDNSTNTAVSEMAQFNGTVHLWQLFDEPANSCAGGWDCFCNSPSVQCLDKVVQNVANLNSTIVTHDSQAKIICCELTFWYSTNGGYLQNDSTDFQWMQDFAQAAYNGHNGCYYISYVGVHFFTSGVNIYNNATNSNTLSRGLDQIESDCGSSKPIYVTSAGFSTGVPEASGLVTQEQNWNATLRIFQAKSYILGAYYYQPIDDGTQYANLFGLFYQNDTAKPIAHSYCQYIKNDTQYPNGFPPPQCP
jgi:hypothetical protein